MFGWFIAFAIFLIIELLNDKLITIWFAIGAIAAMLSTVYTNSFIYQLLVFIIVSIIAKVIFEKLGKKYEVKKPKRKTNTKKKSTGKKKSTSKKKTTNKKKK